MSELLDLALGSIHRLDNWLIRNGWAGYDPYDVRGLPLFIKAHPTPIEKLVRKGFYITEIFFPLLVRKILGVKKQINAKAMGLFADGYLTLYQVTNDITYLKKAEEALEWLGKNYSKGYSGMCWGYPFDWQSRIFIPRGTPSSVVSSTIGNAYWNFYQFTGDPEYLEVCKSISDFFINDLNIDRINDDEICFSYTPIDHFHVHNANLFVAEFLIRVGKEIEDGRLVDLGLQAVNYTLSEQNEDGSLCYWGRDQSDQCHTDHYHSGFEIRSLYSIWKLAGDERIREAVERYYKFYLTNLFDRKTVPKLTPKSTYPINIHACAEALLCNATLSTDFPEGEEYLIRTSQWVITKMQSRDGYFYYMERKIKGQNWKVKIPYIRWGQAWMLKGLSEVCRLESGPTKQ